MIAPDLSRIDDAKVWTVINADCDTAMEDGKRVVRLRPKGKANTPSDIGLALVEGLEFAEGTLEIDLKGKGKDERSFLGVAFSAVDGKTFEAVYFRPFNFHARRQAVSRACGPIRRLAGPHLGEAPHQQARRMSRRSSRCPTRADGSTPASR